MARVTKAEAKAVMKAANRLRIRPSDLIRNAVREYIKNCSEQEAA